MFSCHSELGLLWRDCALYILASRVSHVNSNCLLKYFWLPKGCEPLLWCLPRVSPPTAPCDEYEWRKGKWMLRLPDEGGRADAVAVCTRVLRSVILASCCSFMTLSHTRGKCFLRCSLLWTWVFVPPLRGRDGLCLWCRLSWFALLIICWPWGGGHLTLNWEIKITFSFSLEVLLVQSVKFQVVIWGILQKLTFGIVGSGQPLSSKFPTGSWLFFWS